MTCEQKHADTANKFCPDCGQKLEHFDIDKFNKEIEEFSDKYMKFIEELRIKTNNYVYIDKYAFYRVFMKDNNIKEELFYYNGKFHTKKQMMEELVLQDEKHISEIFPSYGSVCEPRLFFSYSSIDAEYVKNKIDESKYRNELASKYTEFVKLNGYDYGGFHSNIYNTICSYRTAKNREELKKILIGMADLI